MRRGLGKYQERREGGREREREGKKYVHLVRGPICNRSGSHTILKVINIGYFLHLKTRQIPQSPMYVRTLYVILLSRHGLGCYLTTFNIPNLSFKQLLNVLESDWPYILPSEMEKFLHRLNLLDIRNYINWKYSTYARLQVRYACKYVHMQYNRVNFLIKLICT